MSKPVIVSMAPINPQAIYAMVISNTGMDVEVRGVEGEGMGNARDAVKGADIILGDYSFVRTIGEEIAAAAAGSVKLIQQPSVGYQNIDLDAARRHGIPVANTAGANNIGVAEHTIMLALALLKKVPQAHRALEAGEWTQEDLMWNAGVYELNQKNYGILGMGQIGRALAERLRPFGCKLFYFDKFRLPEEEESRLGVTYKTLDQLLKMSDVLSIHVPLTDETRGLINAETLQKMKPRAVLINVSRGEVIDEPALAERLRAKRLGGAGLDVFTNEPNMKGHPFKGLANAILTPHIAGATNESRERIIQMAMQNCMRVMNGEKPINVVNGVA